VQTILNLLFAAPTLASVHLEHGTSNGNDGFHRFSSPGHLAPAALLLTFAILFFIVAKKPAKTHPNQ